MNRQRTQWVKQEIYQLCHHGLDPFAFIRQARRVLREAVPFDASCWLTVDPASLLVTGGLFDYPPELVPAFCRNEFVDDDVNKLRFLARATMPVGILSQATAGHPERSPRYCDILQPVGLESELRAAFRVESSIWGACALYRERGNRDFEHDEAAFIDSLSGLLGAGLRRSLTVATIATGTAVSNGPGLVVLAEDGSIEAISPDAKHWIQELDDPLRPGSHAVPHPAIVYVAGRARAIAAGDLAPEAGLASARIRTRSGRWLLAHASMLEGELPGRAAVILEAARPVEIAPLIVEAYGLSQREQQITELVLHGASTNEMASHLSLSPFTVQDHLKAIFEKMSVRSRREVAARIFFDHHFPPTMKMDPSGSRQFLTKRATQDARFSRTAQGS